MIDEPTPECPDCGSKFRGLHNQVPWSKDVTVPCRHVWHDVEQLELDMQPYVPPVYVEGSSIQERFEDFHYLNPWVLTALERLTEDYLKRGNRKIGMKMLVEVLRWHYSRQTTGDAFKLNNNYSSRYVRLMVSRHPEWETVFEQRSLKAA